MVRYGGMAVERLRLRGCGGGAEAAGACLREGGVRRK